MAELTTTPMSSEGAEATSIAAKSAKKQAVLSLVVDCVPHSVRGLAFRLQLALADKVNVQEPTADKINAHGLTNRQRSSPLARYIINFAPMLAWLLRIPSPCDSNEHIVNTKHHV